jgi:hypothetical protein
MHSLLSQSPLLKRIRFFSLISLLIIIPFILCVSLLQIPSPGFTVRYYDNPIWQGSPVLTQQERDINLTTYEQIKAHTPLPSNHFSISWIGWILIDDSSDYKVTLASDDGSAVLIDNQIVLDNGGIHEKKQVKTEFLLTRGPHKITVRYFNGPGPYTFTFEMAKDVPHAEDQPVSPILFFPRKVSRILLWYAQYSQVIIWIAISSFCLGLGLWQYTTIRTILFNVHQYISRRIPRQTKKRLLWGLLISCMLGLSFIKFSTRLKAIISTFTPFYILSVVSILCLFIGGWWFARKLSHGCRNLLYSIFIIFGLRLIFLDNPWIWPGYNKLLTAADVGYRQKDILVKKRIEYRRLPHIRYLVLGTSQVGAVFYKYAQKHHDFAVFSMAGLRPGEYMLYRQYIFNYQPQYVLLYLSDMDIAVPLGFGIQIAPAQRLYLPGFYTRVRTRFKEAGYQDALLKMVFGEFFPEFKYAFVFQGLLDKALGKQEALKKQQLLSVQSLPEKNLRKQQIEGLNATLKKEYIDANIQFLTEFLLYCSDHRIHVIIVEGQYNPVAYSPENRDLNRIVQQRLRGLAEIFDHVTFVPKAAIFEFTESDFRDITHVTFDAGYKFTQKLMTYLNTESIISH